MNGLITLVLEYFAYVSGSIGYMRENEYLPTIILLSIGGILCFFGFWSYRYIIAALSFLIVATGIIVAIGDRLSWGGTATVFSLVGIIVAYLMCTRFYTDAVIINSLLTGLVVYSLTEQWLPVVAGMVLVAVITVFVPVEALCIVTSVSGGMIMNEILVDMLPGQYYLISIGMVLQIILTLKQKTFTPRYSVIKKGRGRRSAKK